jgi:hypothetical protein
MGGLIVAYLMLLQRFATTGVIKPW